MGELLLWQVLLVLGEWEEDMVEATVEIIMNSLTHSSLNMECMMTSITQTSVSTGLVTSTGILLESIRSLFLMVGFSMSSILLMVTMVVLSWMFHTREKQDILILLLMVMGDMVE